MRDTFRSGYVALIGRTNVGKSTLLNRLVGEKISIISKRPQTTQNRISGILNGENYQIVFLDTPGLFDAKNPKGKMMVDLALKTMVKTDVVAFMVDARTTISAEEERALSILTKRECQKILIINKIDLVKKENLLPIIDYYSHLCDWNAIVPISALNGDGMDLVKEELRKLLPISEPLFPENMITDRMERFIAGEIVREKVFEMTHDEIPYATYTVVEEFKERSRGDSDRGRSRKENVVYIRITIFVEKDSQKRIIIGRGGEMIRRIGKAARKEMEKSFSSKVYLELYVKVKKGWTKDEWVLSRLID